MKDKNLIKLFVRFVIVYEFFILLLGERVYNHDVVYYIDFAIFIFAIIMYVISLLLQEHKLKFILVNILLLPILIPFFLENDPLNSMIYRLLICYGLILHYAVPNLLREFNSTNLLKSLSILFFYILSFGTIMMHVVEGVSFSDGLWWTIVTMTTIGYGDIYPVTNAGRFLALFVIFGGISCMAIFTAFIVEKAVGSDTKKDIVVSDLDETQLNELRQQLKELDETKLS